MIWVPEKAQLLQVSAPIDRYVIVLLRLRGNDELSKYQVSGLEVYSDAPTGRIWRLELKLRYRVH
jgi:hypothetical protein